MEKLISDLNDILEELSNIEHLYYKTKMNDYTALFPTEHEKNTELNRLLSEKRTFVVKQCQILDNIKKEAIYLKKKALKNVMNENT